MHLMSGPYNGELFGTSPKGERAVLIPNYCGDLNACHEAERMLDDDQMLDYVRCLQEDVCRCFGKYGGMIAICHATARQRAEAFVRTIGKWKD